MELIFSFLSGFIFSAISLVLPGFVNMTAAKISLREGFSKSLRFIFGATLVILFQAFLAIFFGRFIDSRPDIIVIFREIGLIIFVSISIYFFWFIKEKKNSNDKKIKLYGKTKHFFLGMLISSLNLFPIPYYVFVVVGIATIGFFSFDIFPVAFFMIGVAAGTLLILYCYIVFFQKIESKTMFFFKNMNKIIGIITAIIALFTLISIIKYYSDNGR